MHISHMQPILQSTFMHERIKETNMKWKYQLHMSQSTLQWFFDHPHFVVIDRLLYIQLLYFLIFFAYFTNVRFEF